MKSIMRTNRRLTAYLLAVGMVMALAAVAVADVTIEQKGKMTSMGGFISADIETKSMIKGDMQCVDSKVKMKGELLGMMGGEPIETSTITRLDKELVWDVSHPEEKYTEMTLAEKRAQMEEGDDGPWSQMGQQGESDGDKIKWSEPKFTVDKTGKTDKIAGHEAEQTIVNMEMEGEDTETGEMVKLLMTMDMFLAKDLPGADEYQAFGRKYAEAMGMEEWVQTDMAAGMMAAMTQYGIEEGHLADELKDIEGYPLRMKMTMNGEGSTFAAMGGGMTAEDKKNLDEAKKALKSFGGLFGGGDDEEESEEAEPSDSDALMEFDLEVKKISTNSIADDQFTPPANYKKQGD